MDYFGFLISIIATYNIYCAIIDDIDYITFIEWVLVILFAYIQVGIK